MGGIAVGIYLFLICFKGLIYILSLRDGVCAVRALIAQSLHAGDHFLGRLYGAFGNTHPGLSIRYVCTVILSDLRK